jgi:hypothetical protein
LTQDDILAGRTGTLDLLRLDAGSNFGAMGAHVMITGSLLPPVK